MAMAARVAYMQATRGASLSDKATPAWLAFLEKEITDTIPDELAMAQALDGEAKEKERAIEEEKHRERHGLEKTAHAVKMYLDSGFTTFEAVVTFHICLVAVTVGLDLSYERKNPSQVVFPPPLPLMTHKHLTNKCYEAIFMLIYVQTTPQITDNQPTTDFPTSS